MELSTELTSQHKHKLHNREYTDDLNGLLKRVEAYLMDFWGWRGKKEQSGVRKGGRESNAAKTSLTYQKGSVLEATIQTMQYAELLSRNFVPESMMAQLWSQLVDLDWEGFVNDKEGGQMAVCRAILPLAHERGRSYLEQEIMILQSEGRLY